MYPGSFNPGLEVYNPRVRPNQGQGGPVKVTVNLFLRAVEEIDAEKNASKTELVPRISQTNSNYHFQTMKLQITFRQQWIDRRLRYNSTSVHGQNSIITIQRVA